jgi:hypothetical protein
VAGVRLELMGLQVTIMRDGSQVFELPYKKTFDCGNSGNIDLSLLKLPEITFNLELNRIGENCKHLRKRPGRISRPQVTTTAQWLVLGGFCPPGVFNIVQAMPAYLSVGNPSCYTFLECLATIGCEKIKPTGFLNSY